jgi:hypothetical protein
MPVVKQRIQSWGLSDFMFVEVFQRLMDRLPYRPYEFLIPSRDRRGGMIYQFAMVDPENRFCEHRFLFRVYYGTDEATLVVAQGAHFRSTI